MSEFPDNDAVCRGPNPLDWDPEKRALMVRACREMALFHREHCREIHWLYDKYRFDPEDIKAEEDIERIPCLGVAAMKYYLILSLPPERSFLTLTSSGTRGQKTQVWFDKESLDRVQAQLRRLWEQEGLVSDRPTNYLQLVYDPEEAQDLGIAFSVKNEQQFAPASRACYAIKKNSQGEWEFRFKETIAVLREYCREGRPVRISGITRFIFELFEALDRDAEPLPPLPEGSLLLTGGGFKTAENRQVTKEEFRALAARHLSIPHQNMRDGYGFAEHSAPYVECRNHRFHIPVYNRVIARDPLTMKALPHGQPGLLEFVTPFNAMMPTLALLSTDVGYVDAQQCQCGWKSPTFTLMGRGGLVKHKGCAIHASEIVKRKE
jgi:phenylacetate-coenzyme A ligase PaaK-like adenylate-forming protein